MEEQITKIIATNLSKHLRKTELLECRGAEARACAHNDGLAFGVNVRRAHRARVGAAQVQQVPCTQWHMQIRLLMYDQ